jgi:hypothetical protein
LLIFSVSGYYLFRHGTELGLAKPTLELTVSTNTTEDKLPMINNVTFEQSGVIFFYKSADSIPDFPELEVNARINKMDSAPASFWASTHYTGDGTYKIKILFREGMEPKQGDILILPIRIVGLAGIVMYKTTAFYMWE